MDLFQNGRAIHKKVTYPVGVPPMWRRFLTVAVRVIGWPMFEDLGFAVTTVVGRSVRVAAAALAGR